MSSLQLKDFPEPQGFPSITHLSRPSCSRTTLSSRADSSNASSNAFDNRAIFSSIGSPSSSTAGVPTYRPA